jgi:hypothetical protein
VNPVELKVTEKAIDAYAIYAAAFQYSSMDTDAKQAESY